MAIPVGVVWVAIEGPVSQTIELSLQANVNLCETLLHRARLLPLRVSLDIAPKGDSDRSTYKGGMTMVLLREAVLVENLRAARTSQGRTLRDVAREARVSSGYLSEVERGQKEASSELLNAICAALGLSLSGVFSEMSLELKSREGVTLLFVDAA